ncbi:hypothetical protein BJ165DRAFT_1594875 [Panaeolus papilionaceus]|nr:hypothetical protein BJ165DRAFT_1594875 [Panaeolus papilionaceus]
MAHIIFRRYKHALQDPHNVHVKLCPEYVKLIDEVSIVAEMIYHFKTNATQAAVSQQPHDMDIDPKSNPKDDGASGSGSDMHMDVDFAYGGAGSNAAEGQQTIPQNGAHLGRHCELLDFIDEIDPGYTSQDEEEGIESDDEVDHEFRAGATLDNLKRLQVMTTCDNSDGLAGHETPEMPGTGASPTAEALAGRSGIEVQTTMADDVMLLENRVLQWRLQVTAEM